MEGVNGGFGLLHEPINGLARAVVAEAVLDVVELNGGVGREADAAVPGPPGRADFAVTVPPPSSAGSDNASAAIN